MRYLPPGLTSISALGVEPPGGWNGSLRRLTSLLEPGGADVP